MLKADREWGRRSYFVIFYFFECFYCWRARGSGGRTERLIQGRLKSHLSVPGFIQEWRPQSESRISLLSGVNQIDEEAERIQYLLQCVTAGVNRIFRKLFKNIIYLFIYLIMYSFIYLFYLFPDLWIREYVPETEIQGITRS